MVIPVTKSAVDRWTKKMKEDGLLCDISAQDHVGPEEEQACAMEESEDSPHLSASVDTGEMSPSSPVLMPLLVNLKP